MEDKSTLMKRMNFVQRKATTSKSKVNFEEKKAVVMALPAELVLNWDQTGIKLVPSSVWMMERQGEKRVEMVNKRQITAVFCGTPCAVDLPRENHPPQVFYPP